MTAEAKVRRLLVLCGLCVLAALVTTTATLHAAGSVAYLHYLVTRGELVNLWAVLSALDVIVALAALVTAWLCLWRRKKLGRAAILLLLPLIPSTVIEASRCDVQTVCETIGWAALPPPAFGWSVRIRDVSEHEAEHLATKALRDAGLPYWAFEPRLSNRQWRLATYDSDMVRAPYDVVIDARTGSGGVVKR
jgi:hypothetical protein